MSLHHRLKRLEARYRHALPAPCRVCGGGVANTTYRLAFNRPGEEPRNERCPACGRQTSFTLSFDRQG